LKHFAQQPMHGSEKQTSTDTFAAHIQQQAGADCDTAISTQRDA
jgi:hypothetical protein